MSGGGVPPGPVVLVVFAIEQAPRLVMIAEPSEESRLLDWLRVDPRVANLLAAALEIVRQGRPVDD